MSSKELLFGIAAGGTNHTGHDRFDIDTRFRMVKDAGVFDYFEGMPPALEIDSYTRASAKHGIPIRATGFRYFLDRDEPLLDWHLRFAGDLGAVCHNIQIGSKTAGGRALTNDDVVDAYLRAYDKGQKLGVDPCLETHTNMWSEHFGRVAAVGEKVENHGVPFNITLDHSHVIFKIDNPREQAVQDMRPEVEAGTLRLHPDEPGNVTSLWIERNYVRHAHARASVPANPVNIWAEHPDGSPGRGVQYPFLRPNEGEWHSPWQAERLEPWKSVVRKLLTHHASSDGSRLGQISMEFITGPDYGGGAKYSAFENNVACAEWVRSEWLSISQNAEN